MAKAAKALPASARSLNRHRLLGGASLLAAILAAPPARAAASPNTRALVEPTPLGRRYLATIAEFRAAWAAHDGEDIPGDGQSARNIDRIGALLERMEKRIAASKPDLAGVIDRAIVAARFDDYCEGYVEARELVVGVLGLAGLTLADCRNEAPS